jgi:hypothetical protein
MRKVNFAAVVNGKMPHIDAGAWLSRVNYCNRTVHNTNLLDWRPLWRHNTMYIIWGIYAGEEQ